MPRSTSTMENIIALVSLRFFNQYVTPKDVASFLKVSDRQAREILRRMIEKGLAEYTGSYGVYHITGLHEKSIEVIKILLEQIWEVLNECIIKGVKMVWVS